MTVGLVIAKGSSRRLERKNMRDFHGKPLFAWSVIQMLNSVHVDRTYVSTDDSEIADISWELGADVIIRRDPEALHPDAAANPVYTEALQRLKAQDVITDDDTVLMGLPTSPCRLPWDFDRMYERHIQLGSTQTVTIVPERETIAYKLLSDVRYEPVLMDKAFRFATQGGAMNAWRVGTYFDWNLKLKSIFGLLNDTEIDKVAAPGVIPADRDYPWAPKQGDYYYPLEVWQQWDIDDQETLDLCRAVFQHYILEPLGADCYERYRDGK